MWFVAQHFSVFGFSFEIIHSVNFILLSNKYVQQGSVWCGITPLFCSGSNLLNSRRLRTIQRIIHIFISFHFGHTHSLFSLLWCKNKNYFLFAFFSSLLAMFTLCSLFATVFALFVFSFRFCSGQLNLCMYYVCVHYGHEYWVV